MELTEKRRKMIFAVIVVTCILCSMLSTALTTALPQMMEEFRISASTGQWLTSIYSLVMGILVLATAFLIKRFRTKRLYLFSLALFTAGIMLDAFTSSFPILMAGRVLQAAGNGILLSLGQVVLLTIYEKEKRGSVMGVYGLAVAAAPVIAPALAGMVVDGYGWRMIFYILLVVSAIALVLTAVTFEDVLENEKIPFDLLSFVLCAAGFGGLLFGMGNLGTSAFTSPSVLFPACAGLAACAAFVYRQLHMEKPFLELRILAVPQYAAAVAASMVLYAFLMALAVLIPVYIQNICGYSATVSGIVMIPGSIAMALTSPIAGKLYDKLGIKKVFLTGSLLMIASSAGMFFMDEKTPVIVFTVLNVIRNISTGLLMMPFVTWGMSGLLQKDTAHGTSLLTSLRTISGAFGSAIFMVLVSVFSSGESAMPGMKAAFAGLVLLGIIELVICACSAFGIREKKEIGKRSRKEK